MEEETEYFDPNHDGILVVFVKMTNARVKGVIIITSTSNNILYFNTFQRLGLSANDLIPMTSSLMGFTSDSSTPL